MSQEKYIEVRRVVSNKEGINTESRPEVIETEVIKSFRKWNKGPKDTLIQGDMVQLVLKEDKKTKDGGERAVTMLIEETYSGFFERMNLKSPIKKVD